VAGAAAGSIRSPAAMVAQAHHFHGHFALLDEAVAAGIAAAMVQLAFGPVTERWRDTRAIGS